MICASCGGASSNTARFCGTCGNPLQRICAACGSEIGSSHRFCSECGVEFDDLAGQALDPRPTERKPASVLFARLVESPSHVEGLDPEEADDLLAPLIEAMRQAVDRHRGVVTAVEGDRIMALFGGPVADERHAIGACYAALEISRILKSANPRFEARIGVHSGEVGVSAEVDVLSSGYVATGPTVQLASELEQSGRAGIPLITAATASLAAGNVHTRAAGSLHVSGSAEQIEICELMGKIDATGSWQARMGRNLTHFVARTTELEHLRTLGNDVGEGRGAVLCIEGEPGVGKSRLIHEYVDQLGENVQVLGAQASTYDRTTPYRPIAEMMRSLLARRGGGAHNLEEVLEALDPSLSVYADAMAALIGGDPGVAWAALDAELRRQTMRRAIRAVIGAVAGEIDTILVFEDVQWLDGESWSALDELTDLAGATPLLMITTRRPGGRSRWVDLSHVETLELEGLMGTEVSDLVNVLVGTRSSTAALRTELGERSDGTPLFLEEIVLSLVDEAVLTGRPGKHNLGEKDLRVDMPAEVRSVIAGRIDRLAPSAKEVLRLVAVHGEVVRGDLLQATFDGSERELSEALAALGEKEMVFEDDRSQPITFTFKHHLVRQAAYASISDQRRQELHRRVAEGVIALDFEQDRTERLAHHTFEAGQWADAARFALASAKRAEAKSAHGDSERFLALSLEALALLPRDQANIEQTIDVLIMRQIRPSGLGRRVADSLSGLDDAEALANEIGDLERVALVNLHRSYARSISGQHHQGVLDAERAHGIGQQLGRRRLTAEANLAKAQHFAFSGHPARVGSLIERDLAFMRDDMGRNGMLGHRVVYAYAHLAIANGLMGRFDAAHRAADDAIAYAKDRGAVLDQVHAGWAAATVQLYAENFKPAAELATEAADQARAYEPAWIGTMIEITRGYALGRLGSFEEGAALLEQSLSIGHSSDSPMAAAWAGVYLSELMTGRGDIEPARSHARAALKTARQNEMRAAEVAALQMLGRSQRDLAESKGLFEEALALGLEHNLEPIAAQIRGELGWVVAELGDRGAGEELVGEANELRRDMGLSLIDMPGISHSERP